MEQMLDIFKAMSDKNRLRILKLLQAGELCACHLVAALNLVQPQISFHMKILKKAGLVLDRRCGRWTYYRLNDTDMFIRFLLLSALERIQEESITDDCRRLKEFSCSPSNPCK